MKKITSILVSVILALSSFQVVFADTNGSMENFKKTKTYMDGQFSDVSDSDWFAESVKNAYELGLISGTSETTFNPNANITLAETITLASRLNNNYYGGTHTFSSTEVWYQTYVDYAVQKGIIKDNEYYDLNTSATRSQFANIFANALPEEALNEINEVDDYYIPDVPMQDNYAKSVYKLYRAGILTGSDDKGTFAPDTNIQRSAVAAIISRMAIESMRVKVTFELPDTHIVDSNLYSHWDYIESPSLLMIDNKLYQYPDVVWFSMLSRIPEDEELELYMRTGGFGGTSCLNFIFEPIIISDNSSNPFIEGNISFDYKSYKYEETIDYISATKAIKKVSIEYEGKLFEGIDANDYRNHNLKEGSFGYWNGVRFYLINGSDVLYNLKDLIKYFELKRSIKYKETEENGYVMIITE